MQALKIVRDLPYLARTINDAQAEIEYASKTMLFAAKRAGEALIEAKAGCAHGEFKAWVTSNCRVEYSRATRYMKIARHFKGCDPATFADLSIEAALKQIEAPRSKHTGPASNLPTFTEDDAEYALKIAARMGSSFEGEAAVAKEKLERLAETHGMTADELIEKAKELCPGHGLTSEELAYRQTQEQLAALKKEKARREAILNDIRRRFATATKDELLELIANWKATGKLTD